MNINNKKSKLDISVAIPVYNEEKSIIPLLESLFAQTYKPKEIIISDGGSKDKTIELINNFIKKNSSENILVKIIGRKGKCRGAGRNIAIENSRSKYIALIDAGHIANQNWLKLFAEIILKNNNIDIIFGSVKPLTDNFFNKIISSFILGNKKHEGIIINTVASIIIKKTVFEKIGYFIESPNGSYVVEDLNFLNKIKKSKTIRSLHCKSAYTNWIVSENYYQILEKYTSYSIGAINSGYFNIWHKNVFRNLIFLLLLIYLSLNYLNIFLLIIFLFTLFFLRAFFYLNKNKWFNDSNIIMKIKYIFNLNFLLILIDYAAIKGFSLWIFKKLKIR